MIINHFWRTRKNKQKAYERLFEMLRNYGYTTGNVLDYLYHQNNYKFIQGARGSKLDNCSGGGGGQTDFAFKVFLRPDISLIRMFAIEILLVGCFLRSFLVPPLFFSYEGAQKLKFKLFIVLLELLLIFLSAFVNLVSLKFWKVNECKN